MATMKKLTGRPWLDGSQVGAVVGEEDAEPRCEDPEQAGGHHCGPQAPGQAQGGGGGPDEQRRREDRPDGDRRQAHRDGQSEHEQQTDDAQADAPG